MDMVLTAMTGTAVLVRKITAALHAVLGEARATPQSTQARLVDGTTRRRRVRARKFAYPGVRLRPEFLPALARSRVLQLRWSYKRGYVWLRQ